MRKSDFEREKKYVYELIGYNGRVPLYILTKDSCSEIARLLGSWIKQGFPRTKIYIYKGKVKGQLHDLLLVEENRVYVIDPTIWQFLKNKKSILVATANSIVGAIAEVRGYYGGKWKLSEYIHGYSAAEIKKLKKVLRKNLGH